MNDKTKKPLAQFEPICITLAILPGIIFLSRGHAQNSAQAMFRLVTIIAGFVVGIGGYAAIKIYQHFKSKDRN
jgi:hypothetical protein